MDAQRIIVDKVPVMTAGGVQSISCVQNELNRHMCAEPWTIEHKPEAYWSMLQTTKQVSKRYNIPKKAQDQYGVSSAGGWQVQ